MSNYTTKVSQKGQIVIPAAVQERMDLKDGVTVVIQLVDSAAVIEKAPRWVELTRGALVSEHPQLEPDDLEELIEATALIETFTKLGNLA